MIDARRRWLGGALLVVAALVVIAIVRARGGLPTDDSGASTPDVVLVTARAGSVADRIEAQGRVGPPAGSGAKIAFAQAGIVRSVAVRVGDAVHAGQPIASLDRSLLAAAVDQARADARSAGIAAGALPNTAEASAQARLALAQAKLQTLERGGPAAMSGEIAAAAAARAAALKVEADRAALTRAHALLAAGVVASKEVDAAQVQLAADEADRGAADARVASAQSDQAAAWQQARADVASARNDVQAAGGAAASAIARLASAQIAYANGVLVAPADGVVLAILKHPGESVDPSQPVIDVGPPLEHRVTLTVPGVAARRVHVGDGVALDLTDSAAGTTLGRVLAVVPAVDPATQVGTIVVDGAPAAAYPGEAVRATITVGRTSGIVLPSTAVVQDPQTGETVVFVRDAHVDGGKPGYAMRRVVVLASDDGQSAIGSGVRPGDRVAAQGGYALLAPSGG
jgi:multidrug efflux pump subunit AcrA (membrane-fusion protein)